MRREVGLPAADERRRHRLRADVHQPPLRQLVVLDFEVAAVERVQNVLRPRHEQPDNRTFLPGDGLQHILRLGALEQHGLAAGNQTAEPVHLRARVVQRRDAQEHVVLRLAVVRLLDARGVHQALVVVQNRLREAGRAGGKVDGRVVLVAQRNARALAGAVGRERVVVLREHRTAALSDVEQQAVAAQLVRNRLDAPDEVAAEDDDIHLRQLGAVLDLVRIVPEIKRHGERARLERAEIDRQPLQAVHQQDGNLVTLFDAAAEQQIGEAVRLFVKNAPRDLAAVARRRRRLHQVVFLPRDAADLLDLRIQLDQRDVVAVALAVPFQ